MLEALIVTLREGIEVALVVGIIAAFLRREAGGRHLGAVWAAILAAIAASVVGGFLLRRLAISEEVLEGVLYLVAAVVVGSMLVWMWRHSRALSGQVKGTLARIVTRERAAAAGAGIFLFTFLMVFREGMETVLFLSALSLTTGGLETLLGVLGGLIAAFVFGVLFVRGSLRVDLGRFFKITGIALLIFVAQLLVNGYHELAEAGWLPANQTSMATIGPLVKNEFFFIVAVLALPLLMLLVPGSGGRRGAASPPAIAADAPLGSPAPLGSAAPLARVTPMGTAPGGGSATARLERAAAERQARARVWGGSLGVAILAALGLGFVYSRPPATLSAASPVAVGADGLVRLPVADFRGTALRRYVVTLGSATVRFIVVPLDDPGKPGTAIATAFDACEICGAKGYYQEGGNVTCLHCGSTIYPPSIGQHGGCNPVPLPSRRQGGELLLRATDLAAGAPLFDASASHHGM
ncbi:MAG TPA: Fe-S-containing protein [Thermoanaerobaculia bacterium]|nr:Fe-S-containing protein [Thermoanaerobaculia bacterium]